MQDIELKPKSNEVKQPRLKSEKAQADLLAKPKQSWLKRIFWICLVLVLIAIAVNFSYFWQNIKYTLVKPKPVSTADLRQEKPNNLMEPNTLIVDSLGLKLPIVESKEKNETAFQEALQSGVVHYPETAKPGEYGNVYVFGHSSDYSWAKGNYKTAFALLPRIKNGAEIIISDEVGNPYKYKVVETRVIAPDDLSVLDQKAYEKRLLTLQTSYPIGTALKRFIVVAEILDPQINEPLPNVGT